MTPKTLIPSAAAARSFVRTAISRSADHAAADARHRDPAEHEHDEGHDPVAHPVRDGVDVDPEQGLAGNLSEAGCADPLRVREDHRVHAHGEAERDDGEVDPARAQSRDREQEPHRDRDGDGDEDGELERPAPLADETRRHERRDSREGELGERQLARVAEQDDDGQHHDRPAERDSERRLQRHVEPVELGEQEPDDDAGQPAPADLAVAELRQALDTWPRTGSPSPRTTSSTMITRNGSVCLKPQVKPVSET